MIKKLLVIFEYGGDVTWHLCKDWATFRADKEEMFPDLERSDIFCCFWVLDEEPNDLEFYGPQEVK